MNIAPFDSSSAAAASFITTGTTRVRIKMMAGQLLDVEVAVGARIAELKRALAAAHPELHLPSIGQLQLVLMPAHGGAEPFEVLVNARTLDSCHLNTDAVLELVVLDALPTVSKVRRTRF